MILKSKTYTSPSSNLGKLLDYLWQDKKVMLDEEGKALSFTKNLRGNRSTWLQQFNALEQRRQYSYGNRHVRYYQEFLSFSPKSSNVLTPIILTDLIDYYLSIRTSSPVLSCVVVHKDRSHIHCHIILSGTDRFGNSIRLSKSQFKKDVQTKLENYQMERYPCLSDSFIGYGQQERIKTKKPLDNEFQMNKRANVKSLKETIRESIEAVFLTSNSLDAFKQGLAKQGINMYDRDSKLHGVYFGNRKWRLNRTLGIDFEKLLVPDKKKERLEQLQTMRKRNMEQRINKERGN